MNGSNTCALLGGPRSWRFRFMLAASALLLYACSSTSAFQKGFETGWGSGGSEQAVFERLRAQKPPAPLPAVVGVTGRGLVGRTVPDGKRWEYTGAVDTLPALSNGVVAISGDGVVTLIDVRTGDILWNDVPSQGRLLEAMAYDGKHALIVLADPDDSRPDLLLLVLTTEQKSTAKSDSPSPAKGHGQVLQSATSEAALGRPAAVSGLGLVPWNAEFVTALDLETGEPIGRIDAPNGPTAIRSNEEGIVLFGRGVVQLNEHVLDDPPPKALKLPKKALPGGPAWPGDGTLTRQAEGESVAILARPTLRKGKLRFAAGAFASTYYRVVLGFGAQKAELRWATYFLRDILAGAAGPSGPTLCLEDGSIWRLSWKDGARAPSGNLDARLRACVLEADPRPINARVAEPLVQQVAGTLTDTGPDMAPVHQLLLDELSKNASAAVTGILLDIARSPNASADLADQAARRIAKRRTGAEHMIAALEEGPEGSSAQRPPPLKQIATALGAMKTKKAAGPLAKHLLDPRASVGDQLAIAHALAQISTLAEEATLREYFSLYRSVAGEPQLEQAVLLVAETLWRLGSDDGRNLVAEAARDPMTHPSVRAELEKLLARVDPPAARAVPGPAVTAPKP
jgi:hypothetical protein